MGFLLQLHEWVEDDALGGSFHAAGVGDDGRPEDYRLGILSTGFGSSADVTGDGR